MQSSLSAFLLALVQCILNVMVEKLVLDSTKELGVLHAMLVNLRILFRRQFKEHLLEFLSHMTRPGYLRMFPQYIFHVNISFVSPSLHNLASYGKHAISLLPSVESQQWGVSSTEISLLLTQSVNRQTGLWKTHITCSQLIWVCVVFWDLLWLFPLLIFLNTSKYFMLSWIDGYKSFTWERIILKFPC